MNYTAKDIFDNAYSFSMASMFLAEKVFETENIFSYAAPVFTLISFEMELYLKCLYLIEKEKPAPPIHKLDDLYNMLSDESRKNIKTYYNYFLSIDKQIIAMKSIMPDNYYDYDLEKVLKEIAKSFVNWRYDYEKKYPSMPANGSVIKAFIRRIQDFYPDWIQY